MGSTRRRLTISGIGVLFLLSICTLVLAGASGAQSGGPTCFAQLATVAYPDAQFIQGTSGDDVIVTDARTQLIDGGDSNDRVCSGGGRDLINGGPGNDLINGQGGKDNIVGGPGDDRVYGGKGRDVLRGGPGRDRCIGGGGADFASRKTCEFIRGAIAR